MRHIHLDIFRPDNRKWQTYKSGPTHKSESINMKIVFWRYLSKDEALKTATDILHGENVVWFLSGGNEWRIDLDKLRQSDIHFKDLEWLTGIVNATPEYLQEVSESDRSKSYTTIINITISQTDKPRGVPDSSEKPIPVFFPRLTEFYEKNKWLALLITVLALAGTYFKIYYDKTTNSTQQSVSDTNTTTPKPESADTVHYQVATIRQASVKTDPIFPYEIIRDINLVKEEIATNRFQFESILKGKSDYLTGNFLVRVRLDLFAYSSGRIPYTTYDTHVFQKTTRYYQIVQSINETLDRSEEVERQGRPEVTKRIAHNNKLVIDAIEGVMPLGDEIVRTLANIESKLLEKIDPMSSGR